MREEGQTVIFLAADGLLVGITAVTDTIKSTSAQAIKQLHSAGLKIIVLTDDNAVTAAVAKSLGLDDVKADVSPQDNLDYLKTLQQQGHIVSLVWHFTQPHDCQCSYEFEIGVGDLKCLKVDKNQPFRRCIHTSGNTRHFK